MNVESDLTLYFLSLKGGASEKWSLSWEIFLLFDSASVSWNWNGARKMRSAAPCGSY